MADTVQYNDGLVDAKNPPGHSGYQPYFPPTKYKPASLEPFPCIGSGLNSRTLRWKQGIAIKVPRVAWWIPGDEHTEKKGKQCKESFEREIHVFKMLGEHPRIVQYLGLSEEHHGRLFTEATHGQLDFYLRNHQDETIDLPLRLKWRSQAAEALSFVHQKGVVHAEVRPPNFLLHGDNLDLILCGFGGCAYEDQEATNNNALGYANPLRLWPSKVDLRGVHADIFALGSTFYYIMAGYDPLQPDGDPGKTPEESSLWWAEIERLIADKKFPSVDEFVGGSVIQGCWTYQYPNVETLIQDQELSFKGLQDNEKED